MCVLNGGDCSKIMIQPYSLVDLTGCAHGGQFLLQTQPLSVPWTEGAAVSQPPDCYTGAGWLSHLGDQQATQSTRSAWPSL